MTSRRSAARRAGAQQWSRRWCRSFWALQKLLCSTGLTKIQCIADLAPLATSSSLPLRSFQSMTDLVQGCSTAVEQAVVQVLLGAPEAAVQLLTQAPSGRRALQLWTLLDNGVSAILQDSAILQHCCCSCPIEKRT